MDKPDIEFSYEHVTINKTHVFRPKTMAPKQWIDFWEAVSNYAEMQGKLDDANQRIEDLEEQVDDANQRIEDLEEQVEYLRNELNGLENDE